MTTIAEQHTEFGLYIHWPFCLSKCPYCDFNSHVATEIDAQKWVQGFLSELDYMADFYDQHHASRRPFTSVFFGGGTPSLMPLSVMDAVLDKASALFGFVDDVEITAEANPTSVETQKLADFKAAGINRVSMGVQSLNDKTLQFLGRGHDAREAIIALERARHLFDRLSIDLIYGHHGQSQDAWREEARQALGFALDHISLYQLTIETGTQFYSRHRKGEALAVTDDEMALLYEITDEEIQQAGLACYEISNYAKAGAESRHNLTYWRGGEWLGVGPGAYGRLTGDSGRIETSIRRSPAGWLDQIEEKGHGVDKHLSETPQAHLEEIMMMGLRLTEGVPLARLTRYCGLTSWPFPPETLELFIEEGWLTLRDDTMRLTLEGRLRLNFILQKLLT